MENNIEKFEKKMRQAGNTIVIVGWLQVVASIGLLLLKMTDAAGMVVSVISGIILIVCGGFIKKGKKVTSNLWACLISTLIMAAIILATGGSAGIMLIILLGAIIQGFVVNSRLNKARLQK